MQRHIKFTTYLVWKFSKLDMYNECSLDNRDKISQPNFVLHWYTRSIKSKRKIWMDLQKSGCQETQQKWNRKKEIGKQNWNSVSKQAKNHVCNHKFTEKPTIKNSTTLQGIRTHEKSYYSTTLVLMYYLAKETWSLLDVFGTKWPWPYDPQIQQWPSTC